ncbi:carboxypeptidase regulatory-like domain-containing protein [Bremerella sp. JC770]|uniref:carboxypeptidase regulatory-like domain-containing protein n=1 Tax=Bremerella sp. JC770 TaxID=3232137 RepID=UPI00345A379E
MISNWAECTLLIVAQVTVVSFLALILSVVQRHHPARRHLVGAAGLALVLAVPLLAVTLPQVNWWRLQSQTAQPMSGNVVLDDSPRLVAIPHEASAPLPPSITLPETAAADAPTPKANPVDQPSGQPAASAPATIPSPSIPLEIQRSSALASYALAGGWLVGIVISAAIWWWRSQRMQSLLRLLQHHVPTPSEATRLTDRIQQVLPLVGLKTAPRVVVSDLPLPFVIGLFRPTVFIPRTLLSVGSETHLRDVLIHELAHIVRRDAWISLAQRCVIALWWWHPGVIALNRSLTRAREEICDNYVLKHGDACHYAETLVMLSENKTGAGSIQPAMGMWGLRWPLENRIRELLKPGRDTMTHSSYRMALFAFLLLGSACCVVGGVRAEEEQTTPAKLLPATIAEADQTLEKITIKGKCLDENGDPLDGVIVLVLRRSEDFTSYDIAGKTKTNAEGHYQLAGIATAKPRHGDLVAVATLAEHVTACRPLGETKEDVVDRDLILSSKTRTLSGVVRDPYGKPIAGATVYVSCGIGQALPGIRSSVTGEDGKYEINDLAYWTPESTRTFDKKTGTGSMQASYAFSVSHPDYPTTTAQCEKVPSFVNVTLQPPAIIEGMVTDEVTGEPAVGVGVQAQGIARSGWGQTETDAQGRYQLRLTKDHYNVWANAPGRIALAAKTIEAIPGKSASNIDIRLVEGGFVTGTVYTTKDKPAGPTDPQTNRPMRVAHYGPARPQSGAAVTSANLQPDGTYRLRVAPGQNYIYCMNSFQGTRGYIDVKEGEEVTFDIYLDADSPQLPENAAQRLARRLREDAQREDAMAKAPAPPSTKNAAVPAKRPTRDRPDTPIGRLLDELEEMNSGPDRFEDVWATQLKQIIDMGADAVPELIAELDHTENEMMLRCMGFTLRGIGDPRAVPALIRAIPKTYQPSSSDMGLRAKSKPLAEFLQKHDLGKRDEGTSYDFGRSQREVFGALHKLTKQSFDEQELNWIHDSGTERQRQLKRQMFHSTASQWAKWWEAHWKEFVDDEAYSKVNLVLKEDATELDKTPANFLSVRQSRSNSMISPYAGTSGKTTQVFYDLDTGRAAKLPAKWKDEEDIAQHEADIIAWATEQGYDMMGTEYKSPDSDQTTFAIQPIELKAWELGQQHWKKQAHKIDWQALKDEARRVDGLLLHVDPQTEKTDPATHVPFMVETSDGTRGFLYVGIEVRDDGLKPGGVSEGDNELNPVAFFKGRRFGWTPLVPWTKR